MRTAVSRLADAERVVAPIELFFDVVYVFGRATVTPLAGARGSEAPSAQYIWAWPWDERDRTACLAWPEGSWAIRFTTRCSPGLGDESSIISGTPLRGRLVLSDPSPPSRKRFRPNAGRVIAW